jgi:hypothetical protein
VSNVHVQVEWFDNGTNRHIEDLMVPIVPEQFETAAAFDGKPTAARVVAVAEQLPMRTAASPI